MFWSIMASSITVHLLLETHDKGFGVLADERHLASKRIYAAGDCLYYENKKKRIEPGFEEVDVIVSDLLKRL